MSLSYCEAYIQRICDHETATLVLHLPGDVRDLCFNAVPFKYQPLVHTRVHAQLLHQMYLGNSLL